MKPILVASIAISLLAVVAAVSEPAPASEAGPPKVGDAALGSLSYDDFSPDDECVLCHAGIARQFYQSMMSECFTHEWDEIECFELALPHALKEEKVAGVKAGCNGCHSPVAFLAGDIPPPRPAAGTRANEAISCDLCHSIAGFEGDVPFNFNYVIKAGDAVQGARGGTESPGHGIEVNPFLATAEMCGTCHNEKDPFGIWVKATHLEWKESAWAKGGIVCQDCHMTRAAGNVAPDIDGRDLPDVRQHLFHGAHDPGKLAGAVEVRIHPSELTVEPGRTVTLTAIVINAKAGHMIPSGSVEERVVWLHVEATDASGRKHHLPVDRKGFDGEEMTIASADALAYQDIGEIQGLAEFEGLKRDGEVPAGDRIFRMPYLDPKERMTISQWNTASLGPDYRLAPLMARNETFTWKLPAEIAAGEVRIEASVYYSRLVSSVGEFLGVPAEESRPELMGRHETRIEVVRSGAGG